MISIGSLEKSVTTLAKKLEKNGLQVEVKTFRSGNDIHCALSSRTSRVDLKVGNRRIRFHANGYGSLTEDRGELGGISATWGEMKKEALKRLNIEL
jgi:hypothetical protein